MVYDLKPEQPRKSTVAETHGGDTPHPQADETIDSDLHCVKCGYNLRGLPRGHRCPECGADVRRSLSGHNLLDASPEWLKQVAWGLGMMLWSVGANLVAMVNWCAAQGVTEALAYLLDWVSAGLAVLGILYLTIAEPSAQSAERSVTVRTFLRVVAACRFVCVAVVLMGMFGLPNKLVAIAWFVASAALVPIILGLSLYLRGFARRMDDYEIERSTNAVLWGFAISVGSLVLLSAGSYLIGSPRTAAPAGCAAGLAGMATLLFGGWFGILLYRYYSIIRWAAYESRIKDHQDRAV